MIRTKDYEMVLICALRYAMKMADKAETITDYIAIELSKLSDECIEMMQKDIEKAKLHTPHRFELCERDWMCLLEQLEEEMGKRYGRT
jgi:hypothetical protein